MNKLLQNNVMTVYCRALYYGEGLKDLAKAEKCIDKAYTQGLKLLEGCYPSNFANMQKIRLYFVKLKMMKNDWTSSKELLLDNLKDGEIELSLRKNKFPSCGNNPKVQRCVDRD